MTTLDDLQQQWHSSPGKVLVVALPVNNDVREWLNTLPPGQAVIGLQPLGSTDTLPNATLQLTKPVTAGTLLSAIDRVVF